MKVAIIGGVSQERFFAGQREGWNVWGLNAIRPPWVRKWSKMFNLHRFRHLERDCPQYVDVDTAWSKRNPEVPMVVVDRWPNSRLANTVLFPREKLRILPRGGVYHAGSFDMMVAYAILLRAEEIAMLAVEFGVRWIPRPPELAEIDAPDCGTQEVMRHGLQNLEKTGEKYDYACCIYPCAPMMTALDLQIGLGCLQSESHAWGDY